MRLEDSLINIPNKKVSSDVGDDADKLTSVGDEQGFYLSHDNSGKDRDPETLNIKSDSDLA